MNLLADSMSLGWILDIVFFALILVGLIVGIVKGFVRGVCKLGGTILAIILAFSMCTPLQALLEKAFGMTTAIANGVQSATVAGWLSIAICFVGLLIFTKLAAWLIGKIAQKLVNRSKALGIIDRILGGLLGLGEVMLFIVLLLTILYWINAPVINDFIATSTVMNAIYTSPWFVSATNLPGRVISLI